MKFSTATTTALLAAMAHSAFAQENGTTVVDIAVGSPYVGQRGNQTGHAKRRLFDLRVEVDQRSDDSEETLDGNTNGGECRKDAEQPAEGKGCTVGGVAGVKHRGPKPAEQGKLFLGGTATTATSARQNAWSG